MIKFLAGVVLGIMFATIGVDGTVKVVEGGVSRIQSAAKAAAQ